jgi:uncharacterized protein YjbI with pentapeptide repeats
MSNYQDFAERGYKIKYKLGHNITCGRVTYLATHKPSRKTIVIKQFQFAKPNSSWSNYDAYNLEVQLLQHLNHPSIPRYVDSFETPSGFCLVQEYKQAPSLMQAQSLNLAEIKQIAIKILEVLVYLQQQKPPVIHRDIKPENILVDWQKQLNIYLVDFGFARLGGGEVAVSSAVKGTLGFMPPEQLFNRQLTEASDLYSLGATIICLLTATKSTEIGNLIDDEYRINFKHLVPKLNPEFLAWLETMVAPKIEHRFRNAADALEALQPIDVASYIKIPVNSEYVIKRKKQSRIKTILILGLFAWIGSIIASKMAMQASVRHLLETNQCPKCDLRGADLKQANLKDANLWSANLEGADLTGADLTNAKLGYANLTNASLEKAKLNNADLRAVQLWNAKLGYADLTGINLGYANLESANLQGANLTNANLWNAKLGYAYLQDAKIVNAELRYANLEDTNLWNTNLKFSNLRGVEARYANLGKANLANVNLESANLVGVNLESANLESVKLKSAILRNANLEKANLRNADLQGAYLSEAKLTEANLAQANLSDANLTQANLERAKLDNANLVGADLERALLLGASLAGANLTDADLKAANLKNANLKNANLNGAYVRGANLKEAKFWGINLKDANLKGVTIGETSLNR